MTTGRKSAAKAHTAHAGFGARRRERKVSMYQIGELLVHPLHGAGRIAQIVHQRVNGKDKEYYEFQLSAGSVRILIPVEGCEAVGVRPVVDAETAKALLAKFPELKVENVSSWNRRYRENMLRLKSGKLEEVLAVIKGLLIRERTLGFSNGEKRMYTTARQILFSELSIALDTDMESLDRQLLEMLDKET